jgi:UPF0755 protein
MGRIVVRLLAVLLAIFVLALGIFLWGYASFTRPGPLDAPATLIVPRGEGLEEIARALEAAGVIANAFVFVVAARVTGADRGLRAGEYAFRPAMSPREVVALLASGETVIRRLTVPEGLITVEVIDQIRRTEGLKGEVPDGITEGSLLPETYHFSHGDGRDAMIGRMRQAMGQALTELWAGRAPDLPITTPEEAVILASIVEKETAREDERARVAAVFLNRLERGMKLDADPTVVYAVTGGAAPLDRALTRADLRLDHPYNTYRNAGLPPGPIANPGRATIAAVLNPADTDELFFVADGRGGHVFARTLEEHNRNVARWRALRRQQQQSGGTETD